MFTYQKLRSNSPEPSAIGEGCLLKVAKLIVIHDELAHFIARPTHQVQTDLRRTSPDQGFEPESSQSTENGLRTREPGAHHP